MLYGQADAKLSWRQEYCQNKNGQLQEIKWQYIESLNKVQQELHSFSQYESRHIQW